MDKFKDFNDEQKWNEIESNYANFVEETNNELDCESYYNFMVEEYVKIFKDNNINWDDVALQYFRYIEITNNELDYDQNFNEFKRIIIGQ
jgi:hypothetical protein